MLSGAEVEALKMPDDGNWKCGITKEGGERLKLDSMSRQEKRQQWRAFMD